MIIRDIRAVLFDLDGVLVDAAEWHYIALNKALSEHGFIIKRREHESTFNGLPTKKKLDMLGVPQHLRKQISARKQKYTIECIKKNCRVDLDKRELMRFLKLQGLLVGCVSNAVRKSVELMLDKAGLLQYIDLIISNEDIKHPKPSPEPYQEAMWRLKVNPLETLVVEDSPYGIKSGKASGARVIVAHYSDVNINLFKSYL